MQKYTLQKLRELAERYSMSFNTLKNYRNNPPKLNSIIISKIAEESEITVEQFEEAFKSKDSSDRLGIAYTKSDLESFLKIKIEIPHRDIKIHPTSLQVLGFEQKRAISQTSSKPEQLLPLMTYKATSFNDSYIYILEGYEDMVIYGFLNKE